MNNIFKSIKKIKLKHSTLSSNLIIKEDINEIEKLCYTNFNPKRTCFMFSSTVPKFNSSKISNFNHTSSINKIMFNLTKSNISNQFYFKMEKVAFLSNVADTEEFLKKEQINYHIQKHEPVFTAPEHSKVVCTQDIKFDFTKNMVCKTKSGKFIYYMFPGEAKADFKAVEKITGEKNVRNADDSVLNDFLRLKKGEVTPLALLNLSDEDKKSNWIFVVDAALKNEFIAIHPMDNSYTIWVKKAEILSLLQQKGVNHKILDADAVSKDLEKEKKDKEEKEKESKNKEKKGKDEEKHELAIQSKKTEKTFSDWYSEVITKSEMIDYYDISGCYILRPWAYEIWELIVKFFDAKIKGLGVKNCYFPIFVSQDALEKEKDHVEGFSPEVAWVTHYGDKQLEKKVAIRPTSETVMYPLFAKWISSHRDLPLLVNQWNNVVRWEFKNPTPFIRTREFLWQEGHTVHDSEQESDKFMLQILDFYKEVYEYLLAVPVTQGFKSENEKFAGALRTSTIETLVTTNGKAIQCATSHNLGQNFSKMFDIKYLDKKQQFQYCWQESWGLTTRSIGVMIMVHGDDYGLVLPPRIAPIQVVLVPIVSSSDKTGEVPKILKDITKTLSDAGIRVKFDDDEMHNPGWKYNFWELKGVPLRIEFGKKDLEKGVVTIVPRDTREKLTVEFKDVVEACKTNLDNLHDRLLEKARGKYDEHRKEARDFSTFHNFLNQKNAILTPWCTNPKCEDQVKQKVKDLSDSDEESAGTCKTLCIPLKQDPLKDDDKCFNCGEKALKWTLWGRSY